jgi:hypothetical protein
MSKTEENIIFVYIARSWAMGPTGGKWLRISGFGNEKDKLSSKKLHSISAGNRTQKKSV